MWGKQEKGNKSAKTGKIDTLIGQNSELRGDVVFSGGLHVDGIIKGNVIAEDDSGSVLSLSERGIIEGEVRVPNVILNGSVKGDVYACDHVDLAAQARVTGNVYYQVIEMARGSEVNGSLVRRTKEKGSEPAKPKPAVTAPTGSAGGTPPVASGPKPVVTGDKQVGNS